MTTKVWLGVCVSAAMAITTTRAEANQVPGFLPSTNGLQFPNSWPHVPDWTISVAGVNVPIGDASNGLCGGMVETVIDYFESSFHVPLVSPNPIVNTPLYNYITGRLLDSFTPNNITRLYGLQASPFDGDRQGTMINEWPRIKADIDGGKLSPLTLVRIRSDLDPFRLGQNHQVLAYGYTEQGSLITFNLYDPNHPANDAVTLVLDRATRSATQSTGESVMSFFREDYTPRAPLATWNWRNGFESGYVPFWTITGNGGTARNGYAATGVGYGWVENSVGVASLSTWMPLVSGHTCTMRAAIQTNPSGAINAHMNMTSSLGYPSPTSTSRPARSRT